MTPIIRRALVLALITHVTAPAAHAGIFEKCMGMLAIFLEKPFLKTVENPEHDLLTVRDQDSPRHFVTLDLGEKLGAGYFGTALVVRGISDPILEERLRSATDVPFNGEFVVKMPHVPAAGPVSFKLPWFFAEAESKREWDTYDFIKGQLPAIEAHPHYPASAAFTRGHMPAAPINGFFNSDRGVLLFKMRLKGKGLKDLAEITDKNGGELPEPYRSALKDHYDFAQALYANARALPAYLGLQEGHPFSMDLRPPNLLWVEDPELLASLGYSRPGFVSFEMSAVPLNRPIYIAGVGLSFEEYLAEFKEYMSRELAESAPAP